jgi:hypothetical protein
MFMTPASCQYKLIPVVEMDHYVRYAHVCVRYMAVIAIQSFVRLTPEAANLVLWMSLKG